MAQLDVSAIAWKSWNLVKRHRFLWGLGVLAGGGSYLTSWDNVSPQGPTSGPDTLPSRAGLADSVRTWASAHSAELQAIVFGFIVVFLIVLYISYASRAGLMLSVNYLEEKEEKDPPRYAEAYHDGRQFVWKLLGISLSLAVVMVAVLLVAYLLLAPQVAGGQNVALDITTVILVLVGVVVLFLFFIPLAYFAERAAVLGGYGVLESLQRGWALVVAHLGRTALASVGGFVASLVIGIIFGLGLLCLLFIGVALGFAAYSLLHVSAVSVAIWIVLGLAFIAVAIAVGGITGAFSSAYWTLAYRALAYLAADDAK